MSSKMYNFPNRGISSHLRLQNVLAFRWTIRKYFAATRSARLSLASVCKRDSKRRRNVRDDVQRSSQPPPSVRKNAVKYGGLPWRSVAGESTKSNTKCREIDTFLLFYLLYYCVQTSKIASSATLRIPHHFFYSFVLDCTFRRRRKTTLTKLLWIYLDLHTQRYVHNAKRSMLTIFANAANTPPLLKQNGSLFTKGSHSSNEGIIGNNVEIVSSVSTTEHTEPPPVLASHRKNRHRCPNRKFTRATRTSILITNVRKDFKLWTNRIARTSKLTLNKKFPLPTYVWDDLNLRNAASSGRTLYQPSQNIVRMDKAHSRPLTPHA